MNEPSRSSLADPRFPSGPWRGVYRQTVCSDIVSFPMRLTLKFWEDDRFDGEGEDVAGAFRIRSLVFNRNLPFFKFEKIYANQKFRYHAVRPQRGTGICGTWNDYSFCFMGSFDLWPGRAIRARSGVGGFRENGFGGRGMNPGRWRGGGEAMRWAELLGPGPCRPLLSGRQDAYPPRRRADR